MANATNEDLLRPANARKEPCLLDTIELIAPQSVLLLALERGNAQEVRQALYRIPISKRKSVLLTLNKQPKHQLRTPLMAAAATGDVVIFGIVLEGVNRLFGGEKGIDRKTRARLRKDKDLAMQTQLQLVDIGGANLLMIAASTGSVPVFNAVTREIRPSQARTITTKQDVRGMTYLMYAINPEAMNIRLSLEASNLLAIGEEVPIKLRCQSCTAPLCPTYIIPSTTMSSTSGDEESTCTAHSVVDQTFGHPIHTINPGVPIMKRALEYARQCLWMPEYLRLLQMKDCWDRSIIEHAIVSGRHAIFNATFEIIRRDVYDEEIEHMMEVSEGTDYKQTAMRVALDSEGGKGMEDMVSGKIRHLKKDVAFRAESSTVSSKIQAFIPGNLIVVFQLLLPEIREDSPAPLVLLVLLCCIAPFWAWGASLVLTTHPERQNTLPRVTWARHVLACPSMFFWGLGTSTIGQNSFGWNESMSAAALAVATLIIPAIDSFAAGTGARTFYGTIFVKVLSLYDDAKEKLQSRFKTKEAFWFFETDDEWQTRWWLDHSRKMVETSGGDVAITFDKSPPSPSSVVDMKELYELEARGAVEPEAAAADIGEMGQASITSGRTPRLKWQPHTIEMGDEENPRSAAGDT